MAFCEHLDTYGVQYIKTEASYQQCNSLVMRIQGEGANQGLVDLVERALQEWKADNKLLRSEFCALVEDKKIIIPSLRYKRPHCSECGFVVPKLEYKEWAIAHNGVAALNGEELMFPQPV